VDDGSLARALEYPYDVPDHSFVFDPQTGAAHEVDHHEVAPLTAGRVAVLACGSNGSIQALRRKLPVGRGLAPVPALLADVVGVRSAYTARLASYGAMPATLVTRPGCRSRMHVTFLDATHLDLIDRSEGLPHLYRRVRLPPGTVESALPLDEVHAYVADVGPLGLEGRPIALSAFPAIGDGDLASMSEPEVLTHVAALFGEQRDPFVHRIVDDGHHRDEVNDALARLALPTAGLRPG